MGLALTQAFTFGDNGQHTVEVTLKDGDRTPSTLEEYLYVLDHITQICEDEGEAFLANAYVKKLTKILLEKYQEHLRATQSDWYDKDNPKLYTVAKQLEAFAFLTGEQEGIEAINKEFPLLEGIKSEYKSYHGDNNFLDKDVPLKFKNFNRPLLALQMMMRVLDPRYINQRDEQVCGVNAFVHNITLFNPMKYVHIVSELASTGVCDLKEFAGKEGVLRVEVTEGVAKKESSDGSDIRDADHIILNGIRSSENTMIRYSSEGPELAKQLFGVTTHNEIKRWMKQAGYHHVQNIPVHEKEAVKQLNLLIKDGYMVGLAGTGSLANYILNPEEGAPDSQNVVQRFMDGHFFIIRDIDFDEETDKVHVRIMTWGEEKSASIPFADWKKNIGLVGTAVVGQDPYMNSVLRKKVQEIDLNPSNPSTYCSPEAYCLFVKQQYGSQDKNIDALLDEAFHHKNGKTWWAAAKEIQDLLQKLPKGAVESTLLEISIIPVVNSAIKAEFARINQIVDPTEKINALEKIGIQNNIEVQRQLIPLYVQKERWDDVREILRHSKGSETDKHIIKECLGVACSKVSSESRKLTVPSDIRELLDADALLAIAQLHLIADATEKINALEKKLGMQNNMEVQRELIPLYVQQERWDDVRKIVENIKDYSRADQKMIQDCLEQACAKQSTESRKVTVPHDIKELLDQNTKIDVTPKKLIDAVSEMTGLAKGGGFTYGLRGRLLESLRSRYQQEGREVHHLNQASLLKKDVYHFVSLLDRELHRAEPAHKIMNKQKLTQFCTTLIDTIHKPEVLKDFCFRKNRVFMKICEFFLKVASYFDKNIITKGVEKTSNFKKDFSEIKENDDLKPEPEHANGIKESDELNPEPESNSAIEENDELKPEAESPNFACN
ncbi:hypothetical protein [Legionella sp. 227]|uniref:hypothetical protein n=1 Tax=Legionella sp. 227 TaxID=3367288 RepID=UPI00370D33DC